MSKSASSSRRRFLQSAAALAAATGLPQWFLHRDLLMAEELKSVTPTPATQPKRQLGVETSDVREAEPGGGVFVEVLEMSISWTKRVQASPPVPYKRTFGHAR